MSMAYAHGVAELGVRWKQATCVGCRWRHINELSYAFIQVVKRLFIVGCGWRRLDLCDEEYSGLVVGGVGVASGGAFA